LYEFGFNATYNYIVVSRGEESLQQFIDKNGPLKQNNADLFPQVATGLIRRL